MFSNRFMPVLVSATLALLWMGAGPAQAAEFSRSRIFVEFNQTANDLGYHVSLDGEDWTRLAISNPSGKKIFEVQGRAAYKLLGMTELFFEGAEPNLDDFLFESSSRCSPRATTPSWARRPTARRSRASARSPTPSRTDRVT